MRKAVAVLGSHAGLERSERLAEELGIALAENNFDVITGAGDGLPLKAAASAKNSGARVYGISPASSKAEHAELFKGQPDVFDLIVYTGFGKSGRNVVLVRSSDAVVMVGGGQGTLTEFALALNEEKPIGVLEGSGGASDKARELASLAHRPPKVVYSKSPKELAERLGRLVGS